MPTRDIHACLGHRSGAQVNNPQSLVHTTSLSPYRTSVYHQVESGGPFDAHKDLRTGIVSERIRLRDASVLDFRHERIYIDVTYTLIPKRGVTCVPEVLTKMGQLLQL